jgi:hypothetical protein
MADALVTRDGLIQGLVLEGGAYVGIHVTLSGPGRYHRGCDRAAARLDQYDAWRLAEPVPETHAAARAASVRRYHRNHGDDLGDGALDQRRRGKSHFIGAARIYSTFSFGFFAFFFLAAE